MPSLGADMESGVLLEWLVKPGDAVKRGDIVAVVDTSKAEIEVEIFADGVIDEVLVEEGARVPVGTVLATVRVAGSAEPAAATAAAVAPAPAAAAPAPEGPAPGVAPPPRVTQRSVAPPARPQPGQPGPDAGPPHGAAPALPHPRVSPVARRMAEQLGVDIASVTGTGTEGAITKADVERAASGGATPQGAPADAPPLASAPAAPAEPARATPAAEDRRQAMREAIGSLMARSKREIPHYYLEHHIDMTASTAWLAAENARRPLPQRLLSSALLLSAAARAVAETEAMNGFWVDGRFHPSERVHLGVAISLRGGGLIAPALHDADRMSLDELMEGLRDLVQRARTGRLRSSEMSDPTVTVTNLGERGVDLVHGVIYPPQVALVGFGAILPRPWADGEMIGSRHTVHATLAADHRVSDALAGSRLLALIDRRLQGPEEL